MQLYKYEPQDVNTRGWPDSKPYICSIQKANFENVEPLSCYTKTLEIFTLFPFLHIRYFSQTTRLSKDGRNIAGNHSVCLDQDFTSDSLLTKVYESVLIQWFGRCLAGSNAAETYWNLCVLHWGPVENRVEAFPAHSLKAKQQWSMCEWRCKFRQRNTWCCRPWSQSPQYCIPRRSFRWARFCFLLAQLQFWYLARIPRWVPPIPGPKTSSSSS